MTLNSKTVVLGMARTPFGKLGGALAPLSATTLGAVALTGARSSARSSIRPRSSTSSFGEVLQAGVGQNPARQVVFKSGLAKTVTADTVNKVCASGLLAVVNAMRSINAGANAVVAAGGMESMSNAPYLLRDARWGYRFGDGALVDAMIYDGLWDQYFPMTMATQGSKVATELGLTREEQDRVRVREPSSARGVAHAAGHFADEIVPVKVASQGKGQSRRRRSFRGKGSIRVPASVGAANRVWEHEPSNEFTLDYAAYAPFVTGDQPHVVVDRDEGVRADASLEAMAKLQPARAQRHGYGRQRARRQRRRGGTDFGRRGVRRATRVRSARNGRRARDGGMGLALHLSDAGDGGPQAARPHRLARTATSRFGRSTKPSPPSRSRRRVDSDLDEGRSIKFGGAVAMGHPIGASGARIVGTRDQSAAQTRRGLGIAAICSGGGQGDAVLISV